LSAQAKNLLTVAALAVALILVFRLQSGEGAQIGAVRYAGLALAIFGFAFWVLARIQLGRSFSVAAKATELVTHGVYSKIRNPIYVFGCVFILGIILWFGRPLFLLVFVVLIPLQIWRARKEAQVLEARFGDAYRAYRAKTWF